MSQFIDQLKAQSGDPRSTTDLTLLFGDQLSQMGRSDVFQQNPDFAQEYQALKGQIGYLNRPSIPQEFVQGLEQGGNELAASGLGLGALGANALDKAGFVGAGGIRDYLLKKAQGDIATAQTEAGSVPSVTDISGAHPIEDTLRYAAHGVGTLAPNLALAAGSGLAGAAAGTAVEPGGGTVVGGVAGFIEGLAEKSIAQRIVAAAAQGGVKMTLQDAIASIPETLGKEAAQTAIATEAKRIAAQYGQEIALAGAFGGQSTGSQFVEHPDQPGTDLAVGAVQGLLGAVAPSYVLGKFLPPEATTDAAVDALGYWGRFSREAAKTIPLGAATTAGSTLVDLAADKYRRGESTDWTANDFKQALNAGLIGGLGGAIMAPFAAIPGGARDSAVSAPSEDATAASTPEAANPAATPSPLDQVNLAGLPPEIANAVNAAKAATQPFYEGGQSDANTLAKAVEVPSGESTRIASQVGEGKPSQVQQPAGAQGSQGDPQITWQQWAQQNSPDAWAELQRRQSAESDGQRLAEPSWQLANRIKASFAESTQTPSALRQAATNAVASANELPKKQPDPNWQVTVQSAQGDIPGYTQIDLINTDGSSGGSYSPEALRLQGYELPPLTDLKQGRYKFGDLVQQEAPAATVDQPKVPIPTVDDVLPVPAERVAQPGDLFTYRIQTPDGQVRDIQALTSAGALAQFPDSTMLGRTDLLDRRTPLSATGDEDVAINPNAAPNLSAPAVPASSEPQQGNLQAPTTMPAGVDNPSYYRAPRPLAESLNSIPDILAYREERLVAYQRLLKDRIGLPEDKQAQLTAILARAGDTARFERTLAPDQRARLNDFFEGPLNQKSGPFEDWVESRDNDPTEIAQSNDRTELAKVIVDTLGNVGQAPQPEASDRFIYPVVALNRLRDIGGSWRDVDVALKAKLASMRAGDDSEELYRAYGESIRGFAKNIGVDIPVDSTPGLKDAQLRLTRRTSTDYLPVQSTAARLLDSTVKALTQDRGIPVVPLEDAVEQAASDAIKTSGIVTNPATGDVYVGYALHTVNGAIDPQSILGLLHEAGHDFTNGLPENLRTALQDGLAQLPWTEQRWLNNPQSLDVRLLANADPETLSPLQREALSKLTPEEIATAKQISPQELVQEKMAEHLAQLGWDRQQAAGVIDRVFRFVKDLWLRTSLAVQQFLKGPTNTNPDLARQFVENRFLQFINRDAAYAADRVNTLKNWLGIPETARERQQNFPGGTDFEMRMQYVDPDTRTMIPLVYGTYTPDSMQAYLQRAIDNAARYIRDDPEGGKTDAQVQLSRRVNFGPPMSLEPAAAHNVNLAGLNLEEGIYRKIMGERDINGLLPRLNGQVIDQPTFLRDWLRLPDQQHPQARRDQVMKFAQNLVDPLTKKPIVVDPAVKIESLPAYDEKLIGPEKTTVTVRLSEQQDEALKLAILSVRDTERRMVLRLKSDTDRLNDLLDQRTKQGADFPKAAAKELDELQRDTLLRAALTTRIHEEGNKLDSAFGPTRSLVVAPGGQYLRVPLPTADESEILTHPRGTVPADLNFTQTKIREAMARDIAANEEWLANPDNRERGVMYGQIEDTTRKLKQIPLGLLKTNTTTLFRRTMTQGLAEEGRLSGLPQLQNLAKRFATLGRAFNENHVRWRGLGGRWQTAEAELAKAMGLPLDQSFRDNVVDTVMRIKNDIDVSRREELKANPKGGTAVDLTIKAMNELAGMQINPAHRDALRNFLLSVVDNDNAVHSFVIQNGLKVYDPELGYERRLVQHGVVTGRMREALPRHLRGTLTRMNPDWQATEPISATDGRTFWKAATDLYQNQRPAFDQYMARLFPGYVVDDFVDPLARWNKPLFKAPLTPNDSVPRFASSINVREAWRAAKGDVTKFAEQLHALEGGVKGDEQQTVGNVLNALRERFHRENAIMGQQLAHEGAGLETLPRQIMDARLAFDRPPEHVSYATYTPEDNLTLLNQLAMNAAFGRDGLAANGEIHQTLTAARRDMLNLWSTYNRALVEGLSDKQIIQSKRMTEDGVALAKKYHQIDEWMTNFERGIRAVNTHSGYLSGDFKLMNEALNLFSTMMIQNPRSGGINTIGDTQGPLMALGLSRPGIKAFIGSNWSVAKDLASSLLRAFGIDAKLSTEYAHQLYVNGSIEPETVTRLRDKLNTVGAGMNLTKPADYETTRSSIARNLTSIARKGREIISGLGSPFQVKLKAGDEAGAVVPKLRAGFFNTTAIATMLANNRAGFDAFGQLASRGVKFINELPADIREQYVRDLELGTRDLDAQQLGYHRGWLLDDAAAFAKLKTALELQVDGESSAGRFAAKAWRRQQAAGGKPWEILSDAQASAIINYTNSFWTLQANAGTIPHWMTNNPLFIFLRWPYLAMQRFGRSFADEKGRVTFNGLNSSVANGMKTFFLLAAPATVAGSFGIDLYDKYALGKKQNLREAPLSTAVPVIGPALNPQAFVERIGRYGSAGFAGDVLNRIVNYDTQRNLSLDDRIVAVSAIENLLNSVAVEPYQTGGNITYASTVRPFLQSVGAGGVLQYLQIANNLLGLNNQEAAINARINTSNYLRAAGRELSLPVRTMTGPSEAPTPVSPYLRQMEIAAGVNNQELFRTAYQAALKAAQTDGPPSARGSPEGAAKYVAEEFASRHPLRRIFASTPTETDYRSMLSRMGSLGQQQVQQDINSYNTYLSTYFNRKPFYGKPDDGDKSVDQLIREAAALEKLPDESDLAIR